MSTVSGLISRKVLPACGSLCVFCPSLRTRSRQPVKRYKKLIAEIFPRLQDEEPNDRKIGKLCDYAAKNPLRIPKITSTLEQKCYKELRTENFRSAKVIMCIYGKLLSSCKEEMPLFASSLLSIMHILLDQTRHNDIRIVGCRTLSDFIYNQKDGNYMFNLEGFIPKLCQLAQEVEENNKGQNLNAAALQALSSMVWFMGEQSNISVEFDNIVSVVLEHYGRPGMNSGNLNHDKEDPNNQWVNGVLKEGHISPSSDTVMESCTCRAVLNDKGEIDVTKEDANNPHFWSRVCVHNMAKLAKEDTTTRRVLESFFRYFDSNNQWSPELGLALPVLKEIQTLLDSSGQNTHFLLSVLVKHLDHKNVQTLPKMQLDIVEIITFLARHSKVQASVSLLSAVSDMMKHLRKSLQCSLENVNPGPDAALWNKSFLEAVDECLVQLSRKIGDASPIMDTMAVMLENISSITVTARAAISTVYRTAQIVASIPNFSFYNKTFPEALFHQLLPAMIHPDNETRIGAHRIFSVVLVPSSVRPSPRPTIPDTEKNPTHLRTLSRTVSVFSSSAALFEKLRKERFLPKEEIIMEESSRNEAAEEENNNGRYVNMLDSFKNHSVTTPTSDGGFLRNLSKDLKAVSHRLSSSQIAILLSSIWAQSISPVNTPQNYEAIAHTYSLVLLFSRSKKTFSCSVLAVRTCDTEDKIFIKRHSSLDVLIRSFQLAFSLLSISLAEGTLPPSRRRSLFTLSTCMIVFSSKAFNITPLIASANASLTEQMVDPFLHVTEDCKLQAVNIQDGHCTNDYGSMEDDDSGKRALSGIRLFNHQFRESFISEILKSLKTLSELQLSNIKKKLQSEFVPDDVCPLGTSLLTGSTKSSFVDEASPAFSIDDDLQELSENTSTSDSFSTMELPDLLGVDQLLESVMETAHEVGRISVSTADMPFVEITRNCEALLMGKHQKMHDVMTTQLRLETLESFSFQDHEDGMENRSDFHNDVGSYQGGSPLLDQRISASSILSSLDTEPLLSTKECQNQPDYFRLPVTSPYDNFLKAAGC